MPTPSNVDGVLVQWGDRLFYPANRVVRARTPKLTGAGVQERAHAIRQRIHAIVVRRAPQVMVKVTGGGRGMAAIAAHLRYISKGGRLPIEDDRGFEREGKEGLRDLVDQWRPGGSRIPEISERREAFNIMLSMPAGTKAEIVQSAAREFAKAELANHRYVMVLHTHQANPHVHLSVRAEGREGQRLNPRKEDLRRWRETFAERLRGWGIEAEASSQVTRGTRHRNERVWERKTAFPREGRSAKAEALPSGIRRQALQAWAEIMRALATSPEVSDRKLAQSINQYLRRMPAVQAIVREHTKQRELPGMSRSTVQTPSQQRRGPEIER
jgi:Relaxase/Mobilisation nuclease domain